MSKCHKNHLIVGQDLGGGVKAVAMVDENGNWEPMISVPPDCGEGERVAIQKCDKSPAGYYHVISREKTGRRGPPMVNSQAYRDNFDTAMGKKEDLPN